MDKKMVDYLRKIANAVDSPTEILQYVVHRVSNVDEFLDVLIEAFSDDSILSTIAFRWWKGEYPGASADKALRYALEQTKQYWQGNGSEG